MPLHGRQGECSKGMRALGTRNVTAPTLIKPINQYKNDSDQQKPQLDINKK